MLGLVVAPPVVEFLLGGRDDEVGVDPGGLSEWWRRSDPSAGLPGGLPGGLAGGIGGCCC